MDGIVIFLIILLIIIILVAIGIVIWYFVIRKKEPTPGGGTGPSGASGPIDPTEGGNTGPNAVSYLTGARTYNVGDTIQFNTLQGTNTAPMGSISGGIWTAGVTGSYFVFADATNDGGGGSIKIAKNNSPIGTQSLNSSFQTTLTTMGYANLIPGDRLQVQTIQGLSVTSPDPIQSATCHFMIQRLPANSSVAYLSNGGNYAANQVINFPAPQQGVDPIGVMSNGVWTPKAAGFYLVFADATNDGGGGSISIKSRTATVGTGFRGTGTLNTPNTVTTMGYVSLSLTDFLSVDTPSGMIITTPPPSANATCHFMIQQISLNNVVSYLFSSSQPSLAPNSVLPFSQLQGVSTDPLGVMNNGVWTCKSPGKYLIFSDATNDGGGNTIAINVNGTANVVGASYSSVPRATGTAIVMGYAFLNLNDNVLVATASGMSATNPDPTTFATCHLILHKIV